MPLIPSIPRGDSGNPFHPQGESSDAGNAERGPLIRGAEKGCYLVTEMRGHKGDYINWKQKLA